MPNFITQSNDTVILPVRLLEPHLGRLMVNPGAALVGTLDRRSTSSEMELMISHLMLVNSLPHAERWSPLADRVVVMVNHGHRLTCEQIPELIRVGHSQTLLCILLDPDDRERFDVCIHERQANRRPRRIGLIGPELKWIPEDTRPPEPFDQTDQSQSLDDLRFSRTRGALGDSLHDRCRHLNLAFVAAGGGGSELARQITASLNPASVTIFDHDVVGAQNLNTMPHATASDAARKRNKAIVLATSLHRNQPNLKIHAVTKSVNDAESLRILERTRFDVVFTFADNNTARLAASWLCRTTSTTHVDVGTLIQHDGEGRRIMRADIRLFEPGHACIGCSPPMDHLQDALYELSAPENALYRGDPVAWNATRSGSLLHLNSLACSLATDLLLSYLSGDIRSSHWIRAIWRQGQLPELTSSGLTAASDCPFCQRSAV